MKESDFLDIVREDSPTKMVQFLMEHGKKPKPISPFVFFDKDNEEERKEAENATRE